MKFSTDEVAAALHRLFIDADGTSLRREDHKKANELAALLPELSRLATRPKGTLVDVAAGKSPLGLVAMSLVLPPGWRLVVVDRAADRAAAAAEAAARAGFADRVDVVVADAADVAALAGADIVTALHACGAASDAVIDIAAVAAPKHLLMVPCCYGAHPKNAVDTSIAGQRLAAPLVDVLPRQGVVGRKVAASLIDVERTLRLEAAGFDTDVVEFVPPAVTPFNLLWRARRGLDEGRRREAAARLAGLSALLGAESAL